LAVLNLSLTKRPAVVSLKQLVIVTIYSKQRLKRAWQSWQKIAKDPVRGGCNALVIEFRAVQYETVPRLEQKEG
jgi:hypothetical protein